VLHRFDGTYKRGLASLELMMRLRLDELLSLANGLLFCTPKSVRRMLKERGGVVNFVVERTRASETKGHKGWKYP
jgi:hypothetical protein